MTLRCPRCGAAATVLETDYDIRVRVFSYTVGCVGCERPTRIKLNELELQDSEAPVESLMQRELNKARNGYSPYREPA
ncbi:MAG: hypothetical protein HOW73_43435 [Polyangiaceae bacterium]|nr:hypothetical protein [Polyangiaceae bacterium]